MIGTMLIYAVIVLMVGGLACDLTRRHYRGITAASQQAALIEQQQATELFSTLLLSPESESQSMIGIASQMAAMGIGPGDPSVAGLMASQYESIRSRYASIVKQMSALLSGTRTVPVPAPVTSLAVNVIQQNAMPSVAAVPQITEAQFERLRSRLQAEITLMITREFADRMQRSLPAGAPREQYAMVMSRIGCIEKALGTKGIAIPFDNRWPS